MGLNREQIIKALECCTKVGNGGLLDDACADCPYESDELLRPCHQNMMTDVLALTKELTDENAKLHASCVVLEHWRVMLSVENERLRADRATLEIIVKDLRFKNKELQRNNEGLAKNIEELEIEKMLVEEK